MNTEIKLIVKEKYSNQEYNVTLERNKSIKIDCFYNNAVKPKHTSNSFNIGDYAEYDSYNLHYTGKIIGITEKTVTIKDDCLLSEVHRLKLETFCWRNWNFNLEKIKEFNNEEMMCI